MREVPMVRKVLLFSLLSSGWLELSAQDHLRLGVAADFNSKGKLVQTISIDLNRTEKVDEKVNQYWLFNKNGYFIQPSADINVGEKTSSADNNITVLLNMGRVYLDKRPGVLKFNKALEFNPTYSSDKNFQEKLVYGQLKGVVNVVKSHFTLDVDTFINRRFSASLGAFSNLGGRRSQSLDLNKLYATAGPLLELKWLWRKLPKNKADGTDPYTDWQLKVSGKGYYLFSEISALYDRDFAGTLQASLEKKFIRFFYLGLNYKYGNDNPTYKDIHTLELGLKFNYSKPKD